MYKLLNKIFKLSKNKTRVRTEILAGLTTFISLAYIIFLTPQVVSQGDAHLYNAIFIAACIASCLGCLAMAFIANWPVAQAPGIGAISFFTYTIMLKLGYSYPVALAINFISSILFIICSVSGIREKIIKAIPDTLKTGLSVGIGIFIAFIGLKNGGIIVQNESTYIGLVSFKLETFGPMQWAAILTIVGLILIGIFKHFNLNSSVLLSMGIITGLSFLLGVNNVDAGETTSLLEMFNDFTNESFLKVIDGFGEIGLNIATTATYILPILIVTFCFFLSDMFNSIGTLIAVSNIAGLRKKDGEIKGLAKALYCDAVATATGTCCGSPTVCSYLESGVGVSEGGRTGLTSLTTAILFLLAILLGPICKYVPNCAIAPALIYVGTLMLYEIKNIKTTDICELIPATVAILFIPLTCDIAAGIALSFISYTLLKVFTGKAKEVSPYMYIVAIMFVFYFGLM